MHDGSFLGLQGVHRAEITGIGPDGRAQVLPGAQRNSVVHPLWTRSDDLFLLLFRYFALFSSTSKAPPQVERFVAPERDRHAHQQLPGQHHPHLVLVQALLLWRSPRRDQVIVRHQPH